jgi:hypothetical protein
MAPVRGYNEWETKKKVRKLIHKDLMDRFDTLADMSELELVRALITVRNYHIAYLLETCKRDMMQGALASLSILHSIQQLITTMTLTSKAAEDELKEDSAQCVMVLGGAIDFTTLGGAKA